MAARRGGKDTHVHAHGCVTCKDRYEDACQTPDTNDQCADCRTGTPMRWVELMLAKLPHVCCFDNSRLARKDEVVRYRLSKGCQWFICNTCKRTFPFHNPVDIPKEQRSPACCMYAVRQVDHILRHRFALPDEPLRICVLCGQTYPMEGPL